MKNINKSLLIFTAISKMLFCSDAAQMPPQAPNPANSAPLVVAVPRTPLLNPERAGAVLTYDNVLEYVGRVGFVLQMMETETKGTHFEIGEIRKNLWAKTQKMREIFGGECAPIYGATNNGPAILPDKLDFLKDLCSYCEGVTKSIPLDLIKPAYVQFDPKPEPVLVFDFDDNRIELTYNDLVARIISLRRNIARLNCADQYVLKMMNKAAINLMYILQREFEYALTTGPGDNAIKNPEFYNLFQGKLEDFIDIYQIENGDISREKERIFKKVDILCEIVQEKLDEIE